ncbi:MAG: alpha/beta hydrolase fold domain-containing protein [Acidobacteriota bacterium]
MTRTRIALMSVAVLVGVAVLGAAGQTAPTSPLPSAPPPQRVPAPGTAGAGPYQPQAILQGGIVVTLFPPDSPLLKKDKLSEPEVYSMTGGAPGRIASIVGIHNPSIEFHGVPASLNTGAVVIVAAGGGHNTLNVGSEGSDFVPFFFNYGINTVILRNRLRRDGYNPQTDEVYDAQQAIRMVRARAAEWKVDPHKIGIMGFSAGAELAAPAALSYEEFGRAHGEATDPFANISARPDFVGLVYPGPTPFTRDPNTPIPADAPPTFIVCAGTGDAVHAAWADAYFAAFLKARIPNLEMHIYANGRHPGDPLPDGTNMTGGLTDRNGTPFGTWQYRLIDWMRDLGFLQKSGVETRAAREVALRVANPPQSGRGAGAGRGAGNAPPATGR